MQITQPLQHIRQQFLPVLRILPQEHVERAALNEFHNPNLDHLRLAQRVAAPQHFRAVIPADIPMVQSNRSPDLADQVIPLQPAVARKNLQRHLPVKQLIARAKHSAEPALSQQVLLRVVLIALAKLSLVHVGY